LVTIAIINSSISNNELVGVVNITGTANGSLSLFTNYSLYYGLGVYPANWTEITKNSSMVNDSLLVEWNTTLVNDGSHTLRLIVNDSNGLYGEDRAQVEVNNVISTLYVGGSGPDNYTTIQNAINDAGNGDTIYVYNGTYNESLMISGNIDLIGENYSNTIIDCNFSSDYIVLVNAEHCNISNFTIQNSLYFGVVYTSSNNSIIQNNYINNTGYGIYLISEAVGYSVNDSNFSGGNIVNNRIENNIFNNSFYGIVCESNYTLACNNTIEGDLGLIGIACNGDNNTIQQNNITNQLLGIYLYTHEDGNISNNVIYNSTGSFAGIDGTGIILYSSNNNTINNNIINSSSIGINITLDSNDNLIYHNNLVNNGQHAYDDGSNNWDNNYPICGNYFDDYAGHRRHAIQYHRC